MWRMRKKTIVFIMALILTAGLVARPERTHVAGVFKEAINVEGELKRSVLNDETIVFTDTAIADMDMDGYDDRITTEDGLKLAFFVTDSTFFIQEISNENNKIAVADVTGDSIPDILQNVGWGGLLLYENTAIKALTPQSIVMKEDSIAYLSYHNATDSIQINYDPRIDSKYIEIQAENKGVRLIPALNWNGSATLTVAYSGGELKDTVKYPVTVEAVNDAPRFVSMPQTGILNEDSSLDIYVDSLLSLAEDADTGDVLDIFAIDERTDLIEKDGLFTYQPAKNWYGKDSLRFAVSDGSLSDTLIYHVRVVPMNDAPQWTEIDPVKFNEDEILQLPLSLFSDHAFDIETPDSLLRFHVYSGEHVVISTEGGKITLLADENWFGQDKLMLRVSDGELADTIYWQVNVISVNDAPVLAELPDTLFYEDETIYIDKKALEHYAFDVETPKHELKWQVKRFGKVRAFYNGREIRCSASPDWYGTDSLELTVSDGELTASRIWRVHVLPVNDAPSFEKKISGRSFLEDDTLKILKTDLYGLVYDPETNSEDLQWTLMPQEHIHFYETEGAYRVFADANWFGNTAIKMMVSDGELTATISYPFRVLSVNDKPIMRDLQPESWNEDDTLSIDRTYIASHARDIETPAKDLMWAFIEDPNVKIRERRNAITLVPDPDWNGDAQIGMIVYDGGLRDTGYMDITIKPVNDAPRWRSMPDTSILEDGSMILPMTFIRSFVSDPDEGDEIKIDYKAGDNLYIEEKSDTLVIWPLGDWYGKDQLEFTASDGKKKVKYTWPIPVTAVNDAPYFTMGLPDSISFRANSSDTLFFEDIVYDIDNDLNDLTWDITPGRYVRYLIDDDIDKRAGIIFYTENYRSGEDAVTIRVTDGHDMIVYYMPVYVKEVDRFLMANPEKLELLPNTPNPFTEYTDIRYSLPVSAQVNIKIYNLLGKEIKSLVNERQDAQNHSVRWWGETESGMPAPSGVYLCRMVAVVDSEPVIMMQKMMLVR